MIPRRAHRYVGFDFETTHLKADLGHLLCAVFKPLGEKEVIFRLDELPGRHLGDDSLLVAAIRQFMRQCDHLYGWFSKGFDLKFLRTRSVVAGLHLDPVVIRHADLWQVGRSQFLLHNNRLGTYMQFTGSGTKDQPSLEDWRLAGLGDPEAFARIVKRCRTDVSRMEEPYRLLEPYIQTWQQVVV